MDTTVARLSRSVMVCKMWATHSHPAFVVKAHWKGAVASSAFLATCFCHCPRHKTSHNISHDGLPHAPVWFPQRCQPSQSHPVQHLSWDGPCAKIDAARDNNSESCSLSNIGWRWSAVIPEGPIAAPLHAARKQMRNWDSSISKLTDGLDWSLLHSTVGVDAAVSFQDSSAPSMTPTCLERPVFLPTRLWQPTTPPRWTRILARSALFSTLSVWCRRLREDKWWACSSLERLLSNNCDHWPFCNSWTRSFNFFLALVLLLVGCGASSSAEA